MDGRKLSSESLASSAMSQSSESDHESPCDSKQSLPTYSSFKDELEFLTGLQKVQPNVKEPASQSNKPEMQWCANLPPEIWQTVFLHLSHYDLGRLLSVNRAFSQYLTKIDRSYLGQPSTGHAKVVTSENIWTSIRKRHHSYFPKPLEGVSELRMRQLMGNTRCQFCNRRDLRINKRQDLPWQHDSGRDCVRRVFPFNIVTCGNCLKDRCAEVGVDKKLRFKLR
jgi:hypothetical protein